MALGGAQRTAALGLTLQLLLGFVLGLEAAPTRSRAQTIGSPTGFQCRISGHYVPLLWHCDGEEDCPDGSDEEECKIEPCTQDGQCSPPKGSLCSCDSIDDCPDGIDKILLNCSRQPCPAGELHCLLGSTCIPHTWLCDGHPDCPDSSDELGCGTETLQEGMSVTPVTLESVTYFRNATATFVRNQDSVQSGNRSAYGVIAAAGMMHSGAKCRFGCRHSSCVVPAPVPARAAGGHEGVPAAAREEDLTALRMSSCHHVAGALSVASVRTCMWLLAHQASDVGSSDHSPADLISCGLEPGDWMCLTQPPECGEPGSEHAPPGVGPRPLQGGLCIDIASALPRREGGD